MEAAKNKKVLILVLVLIALIAGGFGFYVYDLNSRPIKSNTVDYLPRENFAN